MPQIYGMGPTALLPLRRKACWGLLRPKNPTASAGFEPANLGTKGQHATPRPPKPILYIVVVITFTLVHRVSVYSPELYSRLLPGIQTSLVSLLLRPAVRIQSDSSEFRVHVVPLLVNWICVIQFFLPYRKCTEVVWCLYCPLGLWQCMSEI